MPFAHAFSLTNWFADKTEPDPGEGKVGLLMGGLGVVKNNPPPWTNKDGHFCGRKEGWLEGFTHEQDEALVWTPWGRSTCCKRDDADPFIFDLEIEVEALDVIGVGSTTDLAIGIDDLPRAGVGMTSPGAVGLTIPPTIGVGMTSPGGIGLETAGATGAGVSDEGEMAFDLADGVIGGHIVECDIGLSLAPTVGVGVTHEGETGVSIDPTVGAGVSDEGEIGMSLDPEESSGSTGPTIPTLSGVSWTDYMDTPLVVPFPTGTTDGDFVVVSAAVPTGFGTWTPPAGWTTVASSTTAGWAVLTVSKTYAGADGASVSIPFSSGGVQAIGSAARVINASGATAGALSSGFGATATAPTITPDAGDLVLLVGFLASGFAWADDPPTDFTLADGVMPGSEAIIYEQEDWPGGAVGDQTFDATLMLVSWVAYQVAVSE